jgi:hypothetical protein
MAGLIQDAVTSLNSTIAAVGADIASLRSLKSTTDQAIAPPAPTPQGTSMLHTLNANAVIPGLSNSALLAIGATILIAAVMWKHG